MFVFSKLFWLFAQPMSLSLLAILLGLLLGFTGFPRSRSWLAGLGILVQALALFTNAGALALLPLENRFAKPASLSASPVCAILLGGGFDGMVTRIRGNTELGAAGDRYVEGLRLWKDYPEIRLILTGGDPSLDQSYEGDAAVGQRFFTGFGVDPRTLLLVGQSRNTIEDAALTAPVLKENNLADCLLVTSAFHMPRAVGLFRRAGMNVVPWPVDYHTAGTERFGIDIFDILENAQLLNIAIHEYVGLAVAYASGKSDSLLPE